MKHSLKKSRRHRGALLPAILLVLGVVLLLEKFGFVQADVWSRWWPLLLIIAGGWLLTIRISRNNDEK